VSTPPRVVGSLARTIREHRTLVAGAVAVVAPFALAVGLVPLRHSFADTAAALTFVAVIAAVAILGNRISGLVAITSSAVWFDFYLTRPYDRLTIIHRLDLETTICIVVVGLVVNELAAANRRSYLRASLESDYVKTVHKLAVIVSEEFEVDRVIEFTLQSLVQMLMLRECTFERLASGLPFARIVGDGTVVHVGLQWPTKELGIPGPQAEIVAQWRGVSFGRFVLTPTPGQSVSLERRVVAVALASLAAGAIASDGRNATVARSIDDT
jgi:hypothetical protein